jgi:hypothetical protein
VTNVGFAILDPVLSQWSKMVNIKENKREISSDKEKPWHFLSPPPEVWSDILA